LNGQTEQYEYKKLVIYLFEEWGEEIATRVINEINYEILRIRNSPEQFPVFIKSKRCAGAWHPVKLQFSLVLKMIQLRYYRFLTTGKALRKENFNFEKCTNYLNILTQYITPIILI
jgi:hypothetical protein